MSDSRFDCSLPGSLVLWLLKIIRDDVRPVQPPEPQTIRLIHGGAGGGDDDLMDGWGRALMMNHPVSWVPMLGLGLGFGPAGGSGSM